MEKEPEIISHRELHLRALPSYLMIIVFMYTIEQKDIKAVEGILLLFLMLTLGVLSIYAWIWNPKKKDAPK